MTSDVTQDSSERATVLIVDDTADNLTLLSELLKDKYIVKIANSGDKALKYVQSGNRIDLILLDIMMPGIDGYEVCRILQEDPKTWSIPIIFITAQTEKEDEHKGYALGGVDFITKPFNPNLVLARVLSHVKSRQHMKEITQK